MADQGKWFKLWESALDDQDLENLELENWARWARLGVYLKKHGEAGKMILSSPARALQNILRLGTFEAVLRVIKALPGYTLEEGQPLPSPVPSHGDVIPTVTYTVTCVNWRKYQGDFSVIRTRKWRERQPSHVTANVTAQEERRREEKRRDKNILPKHPKNFSIPTAEEVISYAHSIGFFLDGHRFVDHYAARGWQYKNGQPMKDWKAAVRTWKRNDVQTQGAAAPAVTV